MNLPSIIDIPTFERLKEATGADFIGELIDTYCENTIQLIIELKQTLTNQDAEAFRRHAHSIKSTSNSLGALEFGASAKVLEMNGIEGKFDDISTGVEHLESEFDQVQKVLQELRDA